MDKTCILNGIVHQRIACVWQLYLRSPTVTKMWRCFFSISGVMITGCTKLYRKEITVELWKNKSGAECSWAWGELSKICFFFQIQFISFQLNVSHIYVTCVGHKRIFTHSPRASHLTYEIVKFHMCIKFSHRLWLYMGCLSFWSIG